MYTELGWRGGGYIYGCGRLSNLVHFILFYLKFGLLKANLVWIATVSRVCVIQYQWACSITTAEDLLRRSEDKQKMYKSSGQEQKYLLPLTLTLVSLKSMCFHTATYRSFLSSSCVVHEHLFMNSSWTIHEHEMAKFMKLVRFMNLEFINLSSWTCEFMNSSWTTVHDLFINNLKKWCMNSSGIVHEHLFMNSSWIVHE